jgi:hypothetical protein
MLSFKQFLNNLEEQAATTPATGVTPAASTTPATSNPTAATAATTNASAKTQQVPPATRSKLDAAAQKNAAAMRLYQTGKTKEAVDTLRKDPNFQLAVQDLTKTSSPANASQLVNFALGGNS